MSENIYTDLQIVLKFKGEEVYITHLPAEAYIYAELYNTTNYNTKYLINLTQILTKAYMEAKYDLDLNALVHLADIYEYEDLIKCSSYKIIKLYEGEEM